MYLLIHLSVTNWYLREKVVGRILWSPAEANSRQQGKREDYNVKGITTRLMKYLKIRNTNSSIRKLELSIVFIRKCRYGTSLTINLKKSVVSRLKDSLGQGDTRAPQTAEQVVWHIASRKTWTKKKKNTKNAAVSCGECTWPRNRAITSCKWRRSAIIQTYPLIESEVTHLGEIYHCLCYKGVNSMFCSDQI